MNRLNERYGGVRTTGEIFMLGKNIYDRGVSLGALRRHVGMVFQRPKPLPLSIYDTVLFGPRVHHATGNGRRAAGRGVFAAKSGPRRCTSRAGTDSASPGSEVPARESHYREFREKLKAGQLVEITSGSPRITGVMKNPAAGRMIGHGRCLWKRLAAVESLAAACLRPGFAVALPVTTDQSEARFKLG